MSGGIDSTFVATIAVDAIGSNNVTGVSMPSRYSSKGSISDAQEVAKRLKIPLVYPHKQYANYEQEIEDE